MPSIKLVRRLDLIEVSNDDEVITIEESEEVTKIFLRESTTMSGQSGITFELVEYFLTALDIDRKDANILNHLLGAPESELPDILERYDIPLPEDTEDDENIESSDSEHDDVDVLYEGMERGMARLKVTAETGPTLGAGSGNLVIGSYTTDDNTKRMGSTLGTNGHRPCTPPLRELIPSHHSRTESIKERSHEFVFSESLVARSSTRYSRSNDALYQQPPRKSEDSHHNNGGTLSPGYQNLVTVTGKSPSRSRNSSFSPIQHKGGSVEDVRHRETGFFGELFVIHPASNVQWQSLFTNALLRSTSRSHLEWMIGHLKIGPAN